MHSKALKIKGLHGCIDTPENSTQIKGVIIIVPCFTCENTLQGLLKISEILTQRGYATVRIDMTGIGRSLGDFSNLTIEDHINDVVKFTAYVKENISDNIILVGHCIGGLINILANEILPVKGIITLSTPYNAHAYDFDRMNLDDSLDSRFSKININDHVIIIRKDYMGNFNQSILIDTLNKMNTPLLSVFFEDDETLSSEDSLDILKNTQSNIETISLSQVSHFMDSDIESYYIGNLIDIWAQNKLNMI
ncbi:MAG: alpha/beta hydrolase [Clostridiales bacterium]|nr:alpha/beta hydrolase [Clostridiales bacterium]